VKLYLGDAIDLIETLEPESVDAVVTDPPYGTTPLQWDVPTEDWLVAVGRVLVPHGSVWVFGSLRSLLPMVAEAERCGWKLAQEIVWEKQNGSSFQADRFKRVHELAAQFYRGRWKDVYKQPVLVDGSVARSVPRRTRGADTNKQIDSQPYRTDAEGKKMMRSVIFARSCHGYAVHPTQKPTQILRPLIEFSCPPGGVVLDPFAGSGSTAIACRELGRQTILVESDPGYCAVAADRLRQLPLT